MSKVSKGEGNSDSRVPGVVCLGVPGVVCLGVPRVVCLGVSKASCGGWDLSRGLFLR